LSEAVTAAVGWWLSDSFQSTAAAVYVGVKDLSPQLTGESATMLTCHRTVRSPEKISL
jgi:hypothetical protein